MSPAKVLPPQELQQLLAAGAQLVDVRTDHEWEAGRLPGAVHIELSQLEARASEIDRDRPVAFYCRGDNRSDMAAEAFGGAGYDAVALEGGIQAWTEAGLPLEPESGYVAESGEAAAILEGRGKTP